MAGAFFRRMGGKVVEYCKHVGNDYATVFRETCEDCKKRPLKAAVVVSMLGGLTYANQTNPSLLEMHDELSERRQQMVLVPNSEHNPQSNEDLSERTLLLCQDRLHYYNLWFFSLLVKSTHDSKVRIFPSQDANLQKWPWTEFYENILDVGFLGRWYRLEQNFKNYDLNHTELDQLPDAAPA